MLGSDWHIVLADDDSLQRNLLARSLRECSPGVKVTTAGSGAELFDLLEKGTYDCIVLDCHMPPLGVYELLSAPQIRRAECPVIAMSNSKDQGVVIASLRGGAVDFVPKCDAMHGSYLWNCVCRAVSRSRWRAVERRHMVRRQQYLESIAHTDPLTGLLNRRSFERRLAKRVARRDCKAETLACAMLDIDHFKATNDRFGHAAGDAVLAAVGRSIQSLLGPNDAAFRWGGKSSSYSGLRRGLPSPTCGPMNCGVTFRACKSAWGAAASLRRKSA